MENEQAQKNKIARVGLVRLFVAKLPIFRSQPIRGKRSSVRYRRNAGDQVQRPGRQDQELSCSAWNVYGPAGNSGAFFSRPVDRNAILLIAACGQSGGNQWLPSGGGTWSFRKARTALTASSCAFRSNPSVPPPAANSSGFISLRLARRTGPKASMSKP